MDNKTAHMIDIASGATVKYGAGAAVGTTVTTYFGLTKDEVTLVIGGLGVLAAFVGVIVQGVIRHMDNRDKKAHRAELRRIASGGHQNYRRRKTDDLN